MNILEVNLLQQALVIFINRLRIVDLLMKMTEACSNKLTNWSNKLEQQIVRCQKRELQTTVI